jgi:hypothetical protein
MALHVLLPEGHYSPPPGIGAMSKQARRLSNLHEGLGKKVYKTLVFIQKDANSRKRVTYYYG